MTLHRAENPIPRFQPRDPAFAERVSATFLDGTTAFYWGGELVSVAPGVVEITLSFFNKSTGGPGMLHRSIVASLLDDACVLAALSLTSPSDTVATVEYKLNYLAPIEGNSVTAHAEVVRPGRSITVCRAGAFADGRLAARMLATLAVSRPE